MQQGTQVTRPVTKPAITLAAITVLTGAYGVAADSPFVWIYVTITTVLAAIVALVHQAVRFSARSAWLLVTAATINLAGGVLLVSGQPLYVFHLIGPMRFDKPAHAVATGLAALVAFEVLARRVDSNLDTITLRVVAVLTAAGLGALVEIVEYVGTLVIANANVGDYGDNMLDLVANLIGAGLATPLMRRSGPRQG